MTEKTSSSPESDPVPSAKPVAARPELDAVIDGWFAEHFQHPPISHDTGSYNQALAARDALKSLLSKT